MQVRRALTQDAGDVREVADTEVLRGVDSLPLEATNNTGASIPKGSVVYVNGSSGSKPTIALADADTEATSAGTIGVTIETIANNGSGHLVTQGLARGLDTSAFVAGDKLWLSSTAGVVTTTVPVSPAHAVFIGIVVVAHATQGEIVVSISNGFELGELHDVLISAPADTEVLAYDAATGLWKNAAAGGGGGSSTLDGLTDVTLTTPADGHVLVYSSATTQWVNQAPTAYAPLDSPLFTGTPTCYGAGGISSNTTYGLLAFGANTTGANNTAYGYGALTNTTTASGNTAVGVNALRGVAATTSDYNVAVGYHALYAKSSGVGCVAVGAYAGDSITTGSHNTTIGYSAGAALSSQTYCTFVGGFAGTTATGTYSTAFGYNALPVATGIKNVAVGINAMQSVAAGTENAGIGDNVMANCSGASASYNVAVGAQALLGTATTTGYNTAVGYKALRSLTTGSGSVAVGYQAGLSATTDAVTALGYQALTLAYGADNTAVGYNAGAALTSGPLNTIVGAGAMPLATAGGYCTVVGAGAGASMTTGGYNTFIGNVTGYSTTTGTTSTAVGYSALYSTNYNNTTGIGYQAAVTGANQVQLGNSSTTTYVYGTVQNRSDARDKADVRDTVLGTEFIMALRPVDYRWDMREDYKPEHPAIEPPVPPSAPAPLDDTATPEELAEYEAAYAAYLAAQDAYVAEKASYDATMEAWRQACDLSNITHDGTKKRLRYHHGFVAQEIEALIAQTGVDFGGYQNHLLSGGQDVKSVGYDELIAPLVKAFQELRLEFDEYKRTHP